LNLSDFASMKSVEDHILRGSGAQGRRDPAKNALRKSDTGFQVCRVSELRAVELLDDLCEDMSKYTWTLGLPSVNPGFVSVAADSRPTWSWQLSSTVDSLSPAELQVPEAELKVRKRELKSYCYGVLERTEEGLAKYLSSSNEHHEGALP
jgi:hypothetical protein